MDLQLSYRRFDTRPLRFQVVCTRVPLSASSKFGTTKGSEYNYSLLKQLKVVTAVVFTFCHLVSTISSILCLRNSQTPSRKHFQTSRTMG